LRAKAQGGKAEGNTHAARKGRKLTPRTVPHEKWSDISPAEKKRGSAGEIQTSKVYRKKQKLTSI